MIIKRIVNKLRLLITSGSELRERLEELEIISILRGKDIQKFIVKERQIMPIIVDLRKSIRFQEGRDEGRIEATNERNTAFVMSLLRDTTHPIEKIADLVGVPVEFVIKIKEELK